MSELILKLMRAPRGAVPAEAPARETVLVLENSLEDRLRRLRQLTAERRAAAAAKTDRPAGERAR
jgi:hypothetical protein